MASEGNQDGTTAYLLCAMKHARESMKVDYHALAAAQNLSTANLAQRKFKSIIEKSGMYKLVNGSVVDANDAAPVTPATGATDGDGDAKDGDGTAAVTPPSATKKRKGKATGLDPVTPNGKKARKARTPKTGPKVDPKNDEADDGVEKEADQA